MSPMHVHHQHCAENIVIQMQNDHVIQSKYMNIAIIGGGLTGLTSAYELLKTGHRVTVFEKEKTLGGLAGGFTLPHWKWSLEYYYHHFFTNDTTIISLAKELGLANDIIIKHPITATLVSENSDNSEHSEYSEDQTFRKLRKSEKSDVQRFRFSEIPSLRPSEFSEYSEGSDSPSFPSIPKNIYQLDSPMNLLTFPFLSSVDKLRTAALLGFCKVNPFWQPLEKMTAEQLFKTIGGTTAWEILWEPLMKGKFRDYAKGVPASWLWARIKKRTPSLGYFRGGFQTFVDGLADAIKKQGGVIITDRLIQSIQIKSTNPTNLQIRQINEDNKKNENNLSFDICHLTFDKVLITTPSSVATKFISSLHHSHIRTDSLFVDEERQRTTYNQRLLSIPHLWAQTLILETEKPILDNTYWLNVADPSFPFVAVVAHTNMVDKKFYGGRHITYIGNYLPDGHPFLKMTKQQLLKKFLPYLKKINPSFRPPLSAFCFLFSSPSAQPVHTLNYSKKAPEMKTPIEGIYLANLDSIYPWDRGTNYAVELGKKAAKKILNS